MKKNHDGLYPFLPIDGMLFAILGKKHRRMDRRRDEATAKARH